jgi:hypothetical protein
MELRPTAPEVVLQSFQILLKAFKPSHQVSVLASLEGVHLSHSRWVLDDTMQFPQQSRTHTWNAHPLFWREAEYVLIGRRTPVKLPQDRGLQT